ncbi:MAG: methylated-DNA--[protein]-cysteine S-methyltransferase, partial [Clostridia bacterium]|nr:methylated-DNA--[protein]-cysteine S-methyltransferase [Clostridia bacterium]
ICDLTVFLDEGIIKKINFGRETEGAAMNDDPEIGIEVINALDGYFSGLLKEITLPIEPDGTDFQKTVWDKLMEIPYGEIKTYSQVANEIGRPGSARAIGSACNKNPIPLIIPCHRVMGSDGKLTGYAGGIELKKALLEIEKKYS